MDAETVGLLLEYGADLSIPAMVHHNSPITAGARADAAGLGAAQATQVSVCGKKKLETAAKTLKTAAKTHKDADTVLLDFDDVVLDSYTEGSYQRFTAERYLNRLRRAKRPA